MLAQALTHAMISGVKCMIQSGDKQLPVKALKSQTRWYSYRRHHQMKSIVQNYETNALANPKWCSRLLAFRFLVSLRNRESSVAWASHTHIAIVSIDFDSFIQCSASESCWRQSLHPFVVLRASSLYAALHVVNGLIWTRNFSLNLFLRVWE